MSSNRAQRVDTPTVSVCIPTYNYAQYIGQTIESVLAQTYVDFELVVLDDCSTDTTEEVVSGYLDDSRVRYVRHERNRGIFDNFNSALENSSGRYIKFVCADDWLHPRFLADTVPLLDGDGTLDIATTANYRVDEKGEVTGIECPRFGQTGTVSRERAIDLLARSYNAIGMPTNTLIRRTAFAAAGGFDAAFSPAGDVHLWLRMLQHSDLGWVSEPRCFTRIHVDHTHDFEYGASETMFVVWEDAASWTDTLVTPVMLAHGLYAEARKSLIYMIKAAARGHLAKAREIACFTGRHVSWPRVLPRFVAEIPVLAYGRLVSGFGQWRGRLIVFRPRPTIGPARSRLTIE